MSNASNKPGTPSPLGDDDDFKELDSFGPVDASGFEGAAQTVIAPSDGISHKTAVTRDRERAQALNISMASTLIEPLPPQKVAFVELPSGSPVVLSKSVTVIGRAAGVADVVIDDAGVSRQHAAIIFARGEFFLEDLKSSNGTTVDGERVTVVQLTPGKQFSLGQHVCRFGVRDRAG